MVQLTYYPPTDTAEEPTWNPAPDDVHNLRYGYNLADLDVLAKAACRRAYAARELEFRHRYETAWSAIAADLYESDSRPSPADLVAAGAHAINEEARAGRHLEGISAATWNFAPGYERYWDGAARVTPSPETRIVETLALWQIWDQLPDRDRAVLKALAAFGDLNNAATSMDVGYGTYTDWLSRARRAFYRSWHEGERPAGLWRNTRRRGHSRVTETQLETIRDRRAAGETLAAIGADYGLTKSSVSKLLRGVTRPEPDQRAAAAKNGSAGRPEPARTTSDLPGKRGHESVLADGPRVGETSEEDAGDG